MNLTEVFAKKTYGPDAPRPQEWWGTKWRVTVVSLEYHVPDVEITAEFLRDRIRGGQGATQEVTATNPIDAIMKFEQVPQEHWKEAYHEYTRELRQDGKTYITEFAESALLIEPIKGTT